MSVGPVAAGMAIGEADSDRAGVRDPAGPFGGEVAHESLARMLRVAASASGAPSAEGPLALAAKTAPDAVLDPGFDVHAVQAWMNILVDVDTRLARTMTGETTALLAVVGPGGVFGVSAGNSQAWVVTETGFDDLTAGQNKKRLGSGRSAPVSFYRTTLYGTLVLGTDGLFDYAAPGKVADVVRGQAPASTAEGLRNLVRLPSGQYQDDVGIIVLSPMARSPG